MLRSERRLASLVSSSLARSARNTFYKDRITVCTYSSKLFARCISVCTYLCVGLLDVPVDGVPLDFGDDGHLEVSAGRRAQSLGAPRVGATDGAQDAPCAGSSGHPQQRAHVVGIVDVVNDQGQRDRGRTGEVGSHGSLDCGAAERGWKNRCKSLRTKVSMYLLRAVFFTGVPSLPMNPG